MWARSPRSRVSVRWFFMRGQALVFWRLIYIHHATQTHQQSQRARESTGTLSWPPISGGDGSKCSRPHCKFAEIANFEVIVGRVNENANITLSSIRAQLHPILQSTLWHPARNAAPYLLSDERDIHSLKPRLAPAHLAYFCSH